MTQRIDALLNWATTELSASTTARLDAELLLSHIIKKPRSYFFTWPEKELPQVQLNNFRHLIEQRKKGTPVAYLTGEREFWSLRLKVTEATLIPRPDTERLVELALSLSLPESISPKVVDLGTGTGAIALALACERPLWQITAVDKSPEAIKVAKENTKSNHINNVNIIEGSWCEPVQDIPVDMIVSNPPYVRSDDHHLQQGDVRFEPLSALASGPDGLDDIRLIAQQSFMALKINGYLLLEHGFDQGNDVQSILSDAGFSEVQTKQDLSRQDRVTFARKKESFHNS